MLYNNLKIAFRNLAKNRLFSLLNIGGLALGMSTCLVILAVVRSHFGYDEFHPDAGRVYRINTEALRQGGGSERYASAPFPLGTDLLKDYTVADEVVRFTRGLNADASLGELTLPVSGFFTDPSFFRVFGFRLAAGDPVTCLNEPYSLVLTAETAQRFFGAADPLGQTLDIKAFGQFKVTGVLEKITRKTHFDFQCLASNATQLALANDRGMSVEEEKPPIQDWNNYYSNYLYAHLRPGKTPADLNAALAEMAADRYRNLTLESRDAGYRFYAQALTDITPAPELLSNNMGGGLPRPILWGLGGFIFLLILFPCLNYANLTLARALNRAREIGLRKVLGANRRELIRQFFVESTLVTLLALPLAALIKVFLAGFLLKNLDLPFLPMDELLQEDAVTWALWAGFAVVVGLLAGGLPALYLSSLRPAETIRDTGQLKVFTRLGWRKALTVAQFAVSLIFIIVVFGLQHQLAFALRSDYGFEPENLLTLNVQQQDWQALAAEIGRDNRVVQVSAVSIPMGTWFDGASDYRKTRDGEPVPLRDFSIDHNYLSNLGLPLLAGQNFPADASVTRQQYVILNEKALELFQLGTPQEALGQKLWLNDSTDLSVIGVVRNFHFRPLTDVIGPMALRYHPREFHFLNIKVAAGAAPTIMAGLERIWKRFDPVHPLECQWYDAQLRDCYREMVAASELVGFFGLMCVVVACLGLLGIVTYTVETRTKEIGIRKVVGASVAQIAVTLSRHFLRLLALAIVLALPLGYLLTDQLLNTFAYRAPFGVGVLAASVGLLLGLGLLTVFGQTARAALANPVEALRSE